MVGSLRERVRCLLVEDVPQAVAAARLDVSRSVVSYHARALVALGALRVVSRSGGIVLYGPGSPPANGIVPRGGARVHRTCYRWSVVGAPQGEAPWERVWRASRVVYRTLVYRGHRIKECAGPRRRTLVVWPPEDFVAHPDEVAGIEHSRLKRAGVVVRAFAREYGYVLGGSLSPIQPTEYGFQVNGGRPVGRAGIDAVVKDGSPGGGRMEWDVQDNLIAQAITGLPDWQATMEERLFAVETELPVHRGFLERIVRAKQIHVENDRLVVQAVAPGPEVQ